MENIARKNTFKKVLAAALVALVAFCMLPAVQAKASPGRVPLAKYAVLTQTINGHPCLYAIMMDKALKGATKVTATSSDPTVANPRVAKIKSNGSVTFSISFMTEKVGTTLFTINVRNAKGVVKTYNMLINSVAYVNPVKSFKVGSKNYAKKFTRGQTVGIKRQTGKKKISVKPAKNWKVKSITVEVSSKRYKVKNNKIFNFDKIKNPVNNIPDIVADLVNTKTGQKVQLLLRDPSYAQY